MFPEFATNLVEGVGRDWETRITYSLSACSIKFTQSDLRRTKIKIGTAASSAATQKVIAADTDN